VGAAVPLAGIQPERAVAVSGLTAGDGELHDDDGHHIVACPHAGQDLAWLARLGEHLDAHRARTATSEPSQ
jgi:hypothetical protein